MTDGGDLETPVVQGEDNEFYLNHGFDKRNNENGTVFADFAEPIDQKGQPSNIVLFGNFIDEADKTSSSSLLKYKERKFFEEHKTVDFCTIFDDPDTKYQIISCFNYDAVGEKNGDYFFRPRNFDGENRFDKWMSIVIERAINLSDIECTESDEYLTIITKDTENGKDGRFAIVAKKVSETTAEEETSQKEDSLKESTKENRSVEKPDKAVSLKDRVKPDIHAKLEEAYPNNSIRRMNDDRYIISDMGSETSKVMVYDVSSDSVIFTLKDNEKIIDVFEDKFGTYKFVPSGDDKYAFLNVTIFDESGNILYTYEIDTKEAGISEGVENDSQMHISPDGKKLVYRDIQFHQDDKKLDIVDHFVIFKYEDQEHPVDIADYKGMNYVISFAVSNDLLLVYHMTPEFKRTPDLYSLYTDGKEDTAAYDIFVNDDGTLPEYNVKDSTINCSLGRYNELMIIKPDDNGDIRGGNADYSMIEYDLAGSEDGLHNYSLISESGRYFVTVYSTDDNKLIFTLYEIDGDNVTELKSIEKELIDPEYEVLLSASFNEQTGKFSVRRIIKTNKTVTEDRIDSVNFYE
jgi:SrtB family sortase